MILDYIIYLLIGMGVSVIGAVPFGLVNLTVLNVSHEQGTRPALKIAHGASLIEVLFGLTAILAGRLIYHQLEGNTIISFIAAAVLIAGGMYFMTKKQGHNSQQEQIKQGTAVSGILKGAFLNLVSIQVFIFWILAIAFLSTRGLIGYDTVSILVFLAGIWTGKMIVLLTYINLSRKMFSRSGLISSNINRIIGFVLIGMAIVQFIKL
jgi:threonine/homoserine/homoserine lactone efflux protein